MILVVVVVLVVEVVVGGVAVVVVQDSPALEVGIIDVVEVVVAVGVVVAHGSAALEAGIVVVAVVVAHDSAALEAGVNRALDNLVLGEVGMVEGDAVVHCIAALEAGVDLGLDVGILSLGLDDLVLGDGVDISLGNGASSILVLIVDLSLVLGLGRDEGVGLVDLGDDIGVIVNSNSARAGPALLLDGGLQPVGVVIGVVGLVGDLGRADGVFLASMISVLFLLVIISVSVMRRCSKPDHENLWSVFLEFPSVMISASLLLVMPEPEVSSRLASLLVMLAAPMVLASHTMGTATALRVRTARKYRRASKSMIKVGVGFEVEVDGYRF